MTEGNKSKFLHVVEESRQVSASRRAKSSGCDHCGLPVPDDRRERGDCFCCEGCHRVFELIQGARLESFYEMNPAQGIPASSRPEASFLWVEKLLPPNAGGLQRLQLEVRGVHCAACVWLLQQLFDRYEGGASLRINSARGSAEVWWDPEMGDLREYLEEAARFGYRFGPLSEKTSESTSGLMLRMGLAIALAMNVMLFSFCFYFGLGPEDGAVFSLVGYLSLAMTTGAVLVSGSVFIPSALRALRLRIIHLELPIALGLVLAYTGAVVAFCIHGPQHTYFDTVSIFAALMLVGRWLQARVVERNRMSISRSEGTDGLFVRRWKGDVPEIVPFSALQAGDRFLVVPGDLVPVRARLETRSVPASLSLEWISGESELVTFAPGAEVPEGARNLGTTALDFVAEESFVDSRLEALLESTRDHANTVSTGSRWGRISAVYVGVVLTLSGSAMAYWWGKDIALAFQAAVAILIVTCPCAIGLAVPLAYDIAQVQLRRRGVFIRTETLLDRARKVRQIYFDKTGTLTSGELELDTNSRERLVEISPRSREVLAALVLRSSHPRSRSIFNALMVDFPTLVPAQLTSAVHEVSGRGMEVTDDSTMWKLGRPSYALTAEAERFVPAEYTVFSLNEERVVSLSFVEELRNDAATEVEHLQREGYRLGILSGDAPERTWAIASRLNIAKEDAHGGLRPEEKAASISDGVSAESMMVGDGLNDLAGFSAAAVCGTPAADSPKLPSHVDFCYVGNGIRAVRQVLTSSLHLHRVVRELLVFAGLYNVIVLTVAFLGHVGAVQAAILMPLSSISMVLWTRYRMQRSGSA